MTLKLLMVN